MTILWAYFRRWLHGLNPFNIITGCRAETIRTSTKVMCVGCTCGKVFYVNEK